MGKFKYFKFGIFKKEDGGQAAPPLEVTSEPTEQDLVKNLTIPPTGLPIAIELPNGFDANQHRTPVPPTSEAAASQDEHITDANYMASGGVAKGARELTSVFLGHNEKAKDFFVRIDFINKKPHHIILYKRNPKTREISGGKLLPLGNDKEWPAAYKEKIHEAITLNQI
jgi:hypothetical protein